MLLFFPTNLPELCVAVTFITRLKRILLTCFPPFMSPSMQAVAPRFSMWLPSLSCPRPCSPTTHKATSWPPCTPSSCLWAEPARCPSVCSTEPSWPVPDPGTQILTPLLNLKRSFNLNTCPFEMKFSFFHHYKFRYTSLKLDLISSLKEEHESGLEWSRDIYSCIICIKWTLTY